jgi:hypothetical protein
MYFKHVLFSFFLSSIFISIADAQWADFKVDKSEYCRADSAKSASLIGRKVKIWDAGGIYANFNTDLNFKWPSAGARQRGGENGWGNYKPKTGDTGTIVWVFLYRGDRQKYVYLIKVGDNFVPIGCYYVTDLDKPDINQLHIWDSLKNINYAKGCKFKIAVVNNTGSGAGQTKIDSLSETFACNLIGGGVDTVMLCNAFSGVSSTSAAVVFWEHAGHGYSKAFFLKKRHAISERPVKPMNLKPILDYFFSNKLDTIKQIFKKDMQASLPDLGGLCIQVYTPRIFFREFIPTMLAMAYKKEPEAIWWNMVTDRLLAIMEKNNVDQ